MKAISLWEPWATAMALGLKKNETRHWNITYLGDLAICGAKRKMTFEEQEIWDVHIAPLTSQSPAYGQVVCVVECYDWILTSKVCSGEITLDPDELALGNYSDGRFAWLTRNLRTLKTPVPVVGRQGLFNLPPDVEELVKQQL